MKPLDKTMRLGLISLIYEINGVTVQTSKDLTKVMHNGKLVSFNKDIYEIMLKDLIESFNIACTDTGISN